MANVKEKFIVYLHTAPNGKRYVGITCQKPENRYGRNGNGYKYMLFGKAIAKYGWENILHEVVFEGLSREDACKKEQELIKEYKTHNPKYGYNCTFGGDYFVFTKEAKKRNSIAKKLYFSKEENRVKKSEIMKELYSNHPEIKQKISDAHKGKKLSEEHLAKIRLWHATHKVIGGGAKIGHKVSDETKRKLSIAHTGKKMSEEAKRKMSLSKIGRTSPFKGRKMSQEQKDKLSMAHKGYTPTEETRKKLSIRVKQYWDRIKEVQKCQMCVN